MEVEELHVIRQNWSPPCVVTTRIKNARKKQLLAKSPRTICIIDTMWSFSLSLSARRGFLLAPTPSSPPPPAPPDLLIREVGLCMEVVESVLLAMMQWLLQT